MPYGTKSLATVERYAIENSEFLASRGVKLLVVACNTASALALPKIRAQIGLEVIGVIGPGARKAVEMTEENAKIAVIATEATVQSDAYAASIRQASATAEILQTACPLFVFVSRRRLDARTGNFFNRPKILAENHRIRARRARFGLHALPDFARRDSADSRRKC